LVVPPYGSLLPDIEAPQPGYEFSPAETEMLASHAGKALKVLVPLRMLNLKSTSWDHPIY
jgi:hypothetical protein